MISIIIPVYNEELALRRNEHYYRAVSLCGELIFVDGGSVDATLTLAGRLGRVIRAPKGRAVQMNRGANEATQATLLFLHADAFVPVESLARIVQLIGDKKCIGGCFTQILDDPRVLFRWIAWTGNVRARISRVFYGDQGIFVRRDIFRELGGFPDVKIGEDVLFTKRLRKMGRVSVLPFPIQCSSRRWKKQGVLKTFLVNLCVNAALAWNRNLDRMACAYEDIRE